MLQFWINLWTVVLIAGLVVFAILTVFVGIGGFFNIRSLFKSIDAQHAQAQDGREAES